MKGYSENLRTDVVTESAPANGEYVSKSGIRIKMVNGEPLFNIDDIDAVVIQQIKDMVEKVDPSVKAAKDARAIVNEIVRGLGADMEQFSVTSSGYLQEIRGVRFNMVSEVSAMTKELKDVRQFFLGSDYKEQIARLKEFVDLCERLHKLKTCGFLDTVADTMLRLSYSPKTE